MLLQSVAPLYTYTSVISLRLASAGENNLSCLIAFLLFYWTVGLDIDVFSEVATRRVLSPYNPTALRFFYFNFFPIIDWKKYFIPVIFTRLFFALVLSFLGDFLTYYKFTYVFYKAKTLKQKKKIQHSLCRW